MISDIELKKETYLAESWGQPSIGLFTPVLQGEQAYWQPLIGLDACSSSVTMGAVYGVQAPDQDIAAWDALSDEAFLGFEGQFGT